MTTPSPYAHEFIQTNGITLHVVQAGPADGPLVVLLHGFPEFWYGWHKQIPALAAAGFRVWVPDQRGYNLSDKPKGLSAYRLDVLTKDILGLLDASGRERVFLVGHDWGGIVAWWTALVAPERLRHLAILNVPHPDIMRRHLLGDPRQMLRSTYAGFFQLPWLPEALISAFNWRLMVRTLKTSSRDGAFSDADFDAYRRAWSRPGAFTAMLNWYRATAQRPVTDWPSARVEVPTTVLWGAQDFALRSVMAAESIAQCDRGELVLFEENTHWLQHEAPARVNEILLTRFSSAP